MGAKAPAERVRQLKKTANGGWQSWFRRYRYPEQLQAIRELGASGSPEALAYLKRLIEPSVRMFTTSENDGYNNGVDATSISVKYERVTFRRARSGLRRQLNYDLRYNDRDGDFSFEHVQASREQILSKDPHRAIALAIAALENSN